MTSSSAATIVSGAITSLGDVFTAILPSLITVGIVVAVLFGAIWTIRRFAHYR